MIRPPSAFAAAAILLAAACSPATHADADAGDGDLTRAATPPAPPIFPSLPRQRIVLLSSLPLVYGEGVDMAGVIAGRAQPHPLYRAMADNHDLVVADVLDADGLSGVQLLVLVQPRALLPEELVAVDGFVRGGGRLLLFADPHLEWPRGMGLGDPRGPLRTALVSPLLAHWGLELIDPGIESVRLGERGAVLVHPGRFGALPGKTGDASCRIAHDGHFARCRVGQGRAMLVADADLLDPGLINDPGESGGSNRKWVHNVIAVLAEEDTS